MSKCHTLVIGVDPGGTTGIGVLNYIHRCDTPEIVDIAQCSPGITLQLVAALMAWNVPTVLAVESFVVGPRAYRSATPQAGQTAREIIHALSMQAEELSYVRFIQRPAGTVKPWATDKRLDAAGLLDRTKGMPHARDALRHALFAAVRDCGVTDPLSREAS